GRIDVSELEERLSAALDARTLAELDRLLADLPAPRHAARVSRGGPARPATVGLPGLRHFHQAHVFDTDRRTAFVQALEHIVPSMVRVGYDIVARDEPQMIVFECRERPAWVPLVCILGFPIGLIALAYKETQRIVVTFDEISPDHTRIAVAGTARRPVRKAFAGLSG